MLQCFKKCCPPTVFPSDIPLEMSIFLYDFYGLGNPSLSKFRHLGIFKEACLEMKIELPRHFSKEQYLFMLVTIPMRIPNRCGVWDFSVVAWEHTHKPWTKFRQKAPHWYLCLQSTWHSWYRERAPLLQSCTQYQQFLLEVNYRQKPSFEAPFPNTNSLSKVPSKEEKRLTNFQRREDDFSLFFAYKNTM